MYRVCLNQGLHVCRMLSGVHALPRTLSERDLLSRRPPRLNRNMSIAEMGSTKYQAGGEKQHEKNASYGFYMISPEWEGGEKGRGGGAVGVLAVVIPRHTINSTAHFTYTRSVINSALVLLLLLLLLHYLYITLRCCYDDYYFYNIVHCCYR